jgi:nucleotide-binding universal stress UspA family protein
MGIAEPGPDSSANRVRRSAGSHPERGGDGPAALVVGVDGSDTSERALFYAFGLARRQGSRIVAVHAVAMMTSYDLRLLPVSSPDPGYENELKQAVRGLALEHGVAACFVSQVGEPIAVIVKVARDEHADAIILGASRALGHRLFGSTAVRAVRRCPCPVTVVP